jgi:hypothetical protein
VADAATLVAESSDGEGDGGGGGGGGGDDSGVAAAAAGGSRAKRRKTMTRAQLWEFSPTEPYLPLRLLARSSQRRVGHVELHTRLVDCGLR